MLVSDRPIDQWDRLETNLHKYDQFNRCVKENGGKIVFTTNGAGTMEYT